MSAKKLNKLSTSTRSASNETSKELGTQSGQELSQMESAEPEVVSIGSLSPLEALYATTEFRLSWDNDIRFHIAENLIRLRKLRGLSQAELGAAMGTSQSAVARIEGEEENITLNTLSRMVEALEGRFSISISPAEVDLKLMNWWESIEWELRGVAYRKTETTHDLLLALQMPVPSEETGTTIGSDPKLFKSIQTALMI